MDKIVLYPTIILGLMLVSFYGYRCWKHSIEFNVNVMINAVLQAGGMVCGLFLIVGILVDDFRALVTGIDIYIVISGLAVLAVSVQGFHKDVVKGTAGAAPQRYQPKVEHVVANPQDANIHTID